jgi:hypothetical protein
MGGALLSHGVYKPATPDTGDIWFPAMATNMQILNDHTHNGTDSALLASTTQSISSGSWGAPTNGTYTQTITLPTVNGVPMQYDSIQIEFRLSTGERVNPSISRASATTYTIKTIDNSLSYVAIYR